MQVSVENTSDLGRKVKISIPADQIEPKVEQRLKELSSQVKMDGFRPGKVPVHVVKQRFGASARQEVIGKLLQDSLFEAISNEKLMPAGMPEVDEIKADAGEPLEFSAIFEIYPEIKLVNFDQLTAEKVESEITDADIEETLQSIRKQHTEWVDVDRASKNDDKLTLDFEGFIDDKAFEGGKAEGAELLLGSKTYIPGFEEGLVGKKVGDEADLKLKFPEEYHAKDLAGKEVLFKVKVKGVKEPKLPEIDAEFVKKMGVESGDIEEFKKQIREHMQNELERAVETRQKQKLFDQLLEHHEFAVPSALIENEIRGMWKQFMPKHEPSKEELDNAPEQFKEEAKKRVSIGLIIAEVIKANDLKVDHDKVKEQVEKMAQSYEQPQQMIAWYYGDKQRLAGVEAMVLERQVFDFICESAKLETKKLSYSEVMKPEEKQ